MRRTGVVLLLALGLLGCASAHRLDEFLQATLIGVTRGGTDVEIQLTPGVAVLPLLMPVIDQDGDGRISPAEERAYAERVMRDVELRVDGVPAPLSLTETQFPAVDSMREGLGAIRLKLHTTRSGRALHFENRHLPQLSVYLVNCLAATADGLVVGRQKRDEAQRSIEFEYAFGGGATPGSRAAWVALEPYWPAAIGLILLARWALLLYRSRHQGRASGLSA